MSSASSAGAELSSISFQLEDLTQRIAGIASELSDQGKNDMAKELFEIERSLMGGQQRLTKLVNGR